MPDRTLAVQHVTVSYGSGNRRVRALSDLSLSFSPGSMTLIMGPSGSGKSTLLSLLGCLLKPDEGVVSVNGEDVCRLNEKRRTDIRRKQIGCIFQSFRLLHALPAFENVMITAAIAGTRDEKQASAATKLLRNLGMGDKLHVKPNALSGGEQQRVAIARALLADPDILLADEPTASLDSDAGRQICEILRGLADNSKRTVVVVSHDPRWMNFAHRTVVLQDGRLADDRSNTR